MPGRHRIRLSDPYGAITGIRRQARPDGNVSGIRTWRKARCLTREITLTKNERYRKAPPEDADRVIVRATTDGTSLTSALQSGEITPCNGLPVRQLTRCSRVPRVGTLSTAAVACSDELPPRHARRCRERRSARHRPPGLCRHAAEVRKATGPVPMASKTPRRARTLTPKPPRRRSRLRGCGIPMAMVLRVTQRLTVRWLTYLAVWSVFFGL